MTPRALLAALLLLTACSRPPEPLPLYQSIPAFQLTAQDGRAFLSANELAGRVWVADFIFTTCTGPCPRMSRLMKQVAEATRALPNVRYVSFTVDPRNDTPTALAAYAKRYAADTTRWSFLTGSMDDLHNLKREAFKLGNVDGSLNHSTRFVLVDAQGRVRGFYGTADNDDIPKLIAAIQQLSAATPSAMPVKVGRTPTSAPDPQVRLRGYSQTPARASAADHAVAGSPPPHTS